MNAKGTAIGLGNFDGVHIGHQTLAKIVVEKAKIDLLNPSIMLFRNHTKETLHESEFKVLSSIDDKKETFKKCGIENFYELNFNNNLKEMSAEDFVKNILHEKINAKIIVTGEDYRFGKNASGDTMVLKELSTKYNYNLITIPEVYLFGKRVSSTLVKEALSKGDINLATKLLDRFYSVKGEVIKGDGRGKKLGFPTANLDAGKYFLPKDGVYITITEVESQKYLSLTSIGSNPTFHTQEKRIETFLLNFCDSIYNKIIRVYFLDYMRDMIKFDKKDDLIVQMNRDLQNLQNLSLQYRKNLL